LSPTPEARNAHVEAHNSGKKAAFHVLGSNALATQFGYWPTGLFNDPIVYLLKRTEERLNSGDIVSTDRIA
jgi:hypothetical protein